MLKRYYIGCLTASESLIVQESPEGAWVKAGEVKALEEAAQSALEDLRDLLFGNYTCHNGYGTIEDLRAALKATRNPQAICPKCGAEALEHHKFKEVLNAKDWYFTVTLEACSTCGHLKTYEVE